MKAKVRVKGIAIGRLFNLVNYEHIRYETALRNCEAIFGALKPVTDPTGYNPQLRALRRGNSFGREA